jgi:hypothetical protein
VVQRAHREGGLAPGRLGNLRGLHGRAARAGLFRGGFLVVVSVSAWGFWIL